MKKKIASVATPARLLSRLMVPNLDNLSSSELIELFVTIAKQFEEEMIASANVEQLDRLQVQIAAVKDEIYKKRKLNPECGIFGGNIYASFINRN